MLLFLIGSRSGGSLTPAPARGALASLLSDLPFLAGAPIHDWTAPSERFAAAWVQHEPAEIGGARYVHHEERRIALFAGRPIRWRDDGSADGRGPLDARHYLPPANEWAPALDGRVTAARCDDDAGELEVFSDALGAYPVFRADGWFSNSAEALRRMTGSTELDPAAVASVIGCGWPLDGHPIWRAVRRVPRGVIVRDDGSEQPVLPDTALAAMYNAPRTLDVAAAANTLVQGTAALADWPGRPSRVFLTGGRDSRVILAAALHAGIEVQAATGGHPTHPDQVIARELATRAGVSHEEMPSNPHGDVFNDPATGARLIALTAAGTATVADGPGFPHGPAPAPLGLVLSGQGGEIARRYYGEATSVERLWSTVLVRRPWRLELLSDDGGTLVREQIATWAASQRGAGLKAVDLPDAFYLLRRMGTWAGPTHGAVEWVGDTVSPLWSRALLPHLLGLPVEQRRAEVFHHRVVEHLAPNLVDVPFEDGTAWGVTRRNPRAHAKQLAIRYGGPAARAARTFQRRRAAQHATPEPLDAVARDLAQRVGEPILAVLDAKRTHELLARPVATLDVMERFQLLRLASVVAAWDQATG